MEAPAPAGKWAPEAKTFYVALWRHVDTGDTWEGNLSVALRPVPFGEGTYVFASTGLQVTCSVHGDMENLVFSGHGVMQWPDGSRYEGNLTDSKFNGRGTYAWANGNTYKGGWHAGRRQGYGTFETSDASFLALEAEGPDTFAHLMCYAGEWANDLMEGDGQIQYFGAPKVSEDALQHPWHAQDCAFDSNHRGPLLRRFTGVFKKGLPTVGELKTKDECFNEVVFDGGTDAGRCATWYWTPSPACDARGGMLVDLDARGEEYRAVCSRFTASMPSPDIRIAKIQRVQNDDLRCMYDRQRNMLEKKGNLKPHMHITDPFSRHELQCEAAPWQSIVEEGFQATLAGTGNGKVHGAGIYFAKESALAHKYALHSKRLYEQSRPPRAGEKEEPLRMFLTRIVTGVYTVGMPGMNIPPLDPNGAKGEHFHSMVDNTTQPRIFVINDNTRAYPGYLISYSDAAQQRMQLPPMPTNVPTAGAAGAGGRVRKRAAQASSKGAAAKKPRAGAKK